jgi:hypothetical protein
METQTITVVLKLGEPAGSLVVIHGAGFHDETWQTWEGWRLFLRAADPVSPADLAACAWQAELLMRLPHELGELLEGREETYTVTVEYFSPGWLVSLRVGTNAPTGRIQYRPEGRRPADGAISLIREHLAATRTASREP